MLILVADRFDPSLAGRLEEFGEVSTDLTRLAEAEILLVRSKTKCTREFLEGAPHLKLIIRGGIGLDSIDLDVARLKGISVRNTPRASAVAVAELTFSLMLAAASRLVEANNSMVAGEWKKSELKRTELFGKRLCLVGLGSIATEVARRAVTFGMEVCGVRGSNRSHEVVRVVDRLEDALSGADYVSLHVPANDETTGIINKATLAAMKEGVILVNTARAACVVAEDVAAALANRHVRCYAADVWPEDPPAPSYPLLHAPNVIMTPHIGANSAENLTRIGEEVYNAVSHYLREHV